VVPGGTVTSYLPPVTTTAFSTPTSTVVSDDETALRALRQQEADDSPTAEAMIGSWVPQLSAKRPGMVLGGVSFGHTEIWQDFLNLRSRYPGAKLLWSGSYSSFRYKDFWVTVLPEPYATGESANEWCDDEGIVKEDCYAKRLSHSGGYDGNTLVRK
jgi:serine/threonine-protein kinase